MSKNAMRADLSRQMKKTTNQHARILHIGKSGTPNLVEAALQARFLLSDPCGRRLLCTSVGLDMTHTFLSHKYPRADTFLR
jgi:hypothetical protein